MYTAWTKSVLFSCACIWACGGGLNVGAKARGCIRRGLDPETRKHIARIEVKPIELYSCVHNHNAMMRNNACKSVISPPCYNIAFLQYAKPSLPLSPATCTPSEQTPRLKCMPCKASPSRVVVTRKRSHALGTHVIVPLCVRSFSLSARP